MKIPYRFKRRCLWALKALQRRLSQIMATGCLGLILTFLLTQTHLTINQTPSLSYRAFICIKRVKPKKGDFVSICDHPTSYFEGIHYTKRLMGLPGDRIHFKGNRLYVEDILIGPLHKTTRNSHRLHPNKTTLVPQGHVFVSGDHPRSFDSRYEEFGLVKQEHIKGRCFGFFKSEEGAL